MNKDKYICQQFGICWHEWENYVCKHCGQGDCYPNPNFESEVGIVQLLKLMEKHKKYYDFCDACNMAIFTIRNDFITDNTGKFRDTVYKWLGGKEGI